MFVGADEFLYNLLAYRVCWLRGRLGGGKTLLSIAIADELIKHHGYTGVIANFPHALPTHNWRARHPEDGLLRGVRGAVAIWDEAGLFLDRRSFMSNDRGVGALLRKLESVLLLPSVTPPDQRLSYFSVQRVSRLSLFGERWRYRWYLALPGAPLEQGEFWLLPERYYGLYDTRYIPISDGGYMDLWRATVAELGAAALLERLGKAIDDEQEEQEDAASLAE